MINLSIEMDNPIDQIEEEALLSETQLPVAPENGIPPSDSFLTLSKLLPVLSGPLLRLAQPTDISFPPPGAAALHPPSTSAISSVHIRALECLNNLFLSLGLNAETFPLAMADIEGAVTVWQELWNVLLAVGYRSEAGQEQRYEIWTSAVGALWGIARVCKTQLVRFLPVCSM